MGELHFPSEAKDGFFVLELSKVCHLDQEVHRVVDVDAGRNALGEHEAGGVAFDDAAHLDAPSLNPVEVLTLE